MNNFKQEILNELDSRLDRLKEHEHDDKPTDGNQYDQLNHALSRVIGVSLEKELEDFRSFVEEL